MEFIDLKTQQGLLRERLDANIRKVLAHGQYIMGPEVRALEAQLAAYVGIAHAVACASGTDALLMALMAQGVGPGDAVFTTPFTFVATAEVIGLLGAVPVFVDIDPETYNLDPAALDRAVAAFREGDPSLHPLPRVAAGRARAVIAVDLFGLLADYEAIGAVAKKHGLFVVEDAAQSFGAERGGRRSCSFGDVACTSFFPAKPLGCYGDGGMCFTADDDLAAALRSLRVHGQGGDKYDNVRIGINGRLDTLQAAILLAKFEIFPEEMSRRQEVADRYSRALAASTRLVVPPPHREGGEGESISAWAQYSLLARDEAQRADLMGRLREAGIPTAIYYPKPLHLQGAFSYLGYRRGDFPVSEDVARRIFSIPMHPYLTETDQERIVRALLG
ncbi:MAG TPA: DegT/DnrJ/EryC1/StrS family aminotransferase [Syntrophales bacterium]|nr:DegT/DnrJ/EryC1/StrS family aminotransferase [Syntrophales bacterium]